jgi:hypothetical protein
MARSAPAADEKVAAGRSLPDAGELAPPVDTSDAIRDAYRFHRTKRRIKIERKHAARYADVRFAFTLALLVFVSVVLGLTVWAEVRRLFGL